MCLINLFHGPKYNNIQNQLIKPTYFWQGKILKVKKELEVIREDCFEQWVFYLLVININLFLN